MFNLAHESFARHGDSFFLIKDGGVLIVSETSLKNEYEEIQKKWLFLYEQRQEVLEVAKQNVLQAIKQKDLERQRALEAEGVSGTGQRSFSSAACILCLGIEGFLFPLCQEAHQHACLRCLDRVFEEKQILVCPICGEEGGSFGMDEYKKAIGQNEEGLSALITQYQIPDILPLAQDLPNETLLLTEKTTVTLSNIEISEKLFFVLLEKTKITIGERFSITKYVDSEDCIREHSMARETPFCLRDGAVSSLALENIERMAPNSIGCSLKDIKLYNTGLINILPKLRINEDCEFESLVVTASKEEHIAAILTQDKPFYVGRVKEMCLKNYAVSTLPKLRVHVIEFLKLVATEKEHVSTILAQDQKLCVGRVKEMKLEGYAVFVFLKMKETRENLESLVLSISKDELWRKMHGKIKKENIAICVEEVENLFLTEHAVNILPALKTKGEMDLFFLDADTEDQVSEVLAKEYKGISFGGIKDFGLLGSAVNLLPKIRLKEDCEVEIYSLIAPEERQVSIVLGKEDRSIATGRVKNMELTGYAVCVLPKLRIHNDNTMGSFRLSAGELYFSRIPGEGDSSIELGRIEQKGFDVPKEIRRKLRYTLVDGEGKEILEEERSSSQRGTLFD